ncbi:MAG: LysM peptidoglycan-binding domain-containing protein [Candidatus Melainabacteria bacterium]|nr:LysM peptidoglycan-binding domain-containing protein [Candidatus Melainabacteria bacterium]
MEALSGKDFPHPPRQPRQEDTAEKLRLESSQLLGAQSSTPEDTTGSGTTKRRKPEEQASRVRGFNGDNYTVGSGDSLGSIAQRMLKLRGEKSSAQDVYEEVNRIVDLNVEKYPWLAKNPNKIRPGMVIQVWDKESGPDPTCRWKDWRDAEPGRINVALRCESIFAGKDTQVIVTPGARAVFTENSYGFVAPKGYARALTGAHVMAVGGEVVADGGALQILHPEVKVNADRRSTTSEKAILATNEIAPAADVKVSPSHSSASTEETIDVPPI